MYSGKCQSPCQVTFAQSQRFVFWLKSCVFACWPEELWFLGKTLWIRCFAVHCSWWGGRAQPACWLSWLGEQLFLWSTPPLNLYRKMLQCGLFYIPVGSKSCHIFANASLKQILGLQHDERKRKFSHKWAVGKSNRIWKGWSRKQLFPVTHHSVSAAHRNGLTIRQHSRHLLDLHYSQFFLISD